jgi:hypothetical protein
MSFKLFDIIAIDILIGGSSGYPNATRVNSFIYHALPLEPPINIRIWHPTSANQLLRISAIFHVTLKMQRDMKPSFNLSELLLVKQETDYVLIYSMKETIRFQCL